MTDFADEDELSSHDLSARWRTTALMTIRFVPPTISIVCAIVGGYFPSMTAKPKPLADIVTLAVSILKFQHAPPEMRDWAADDLGIQTDIPMPAKSIRQ